MRTKQVYFILLLLFAFSAQAQQISDVQFKKEGLDKVRIYYTLSGIEKGTTIELSLFLSKDGGITYSGALQMVEGDVNKYIYDGVAAKTMLWQVLKEPNYYYLIGDKIRFKVKLKIEPTKTVKKEAVVINTFANYTETVAGVSFDMIAINGGTFKMGSPKSEVDRSSNETQHQVRVSDFYMAKYELSQAEYKAIIGSNPSSFKGDNLPVERVSWYDAVEFCNKLSKKAGLEPYYEINGTTISLNKKANGYRLPTEAEWEYAAGGGASNRTEFAGTNNEKDLYKYANFCDKKCTYSWKERKQNDGFENTAPVGTYIANQLGLYDMSGNVYEWCYDWYGTYNLDISENPTGDISGSGRVRRGGSWNFYAEYCRSAYRYSSTPSSSGNYIGFRLCRNK